MTHSHGWQAGVAGWLEGFSPQAAYVLPMKSLPPTEQTVQESRLEVALPFVTWLVSEVSPSLCHMLFIRKEA